MTGLKHLLFPPLFAALLAVAALIVGTPLRPWFAWLILAIMLLAALLQLRHHANQQSVLMQKIDAVDTAPAANEKNYQTIVEIANEGIWIIDSDGNTTFVNERMAQMLGYSVEQFMGRSMFDFMDEESVKEAQQNMARRSEGIDEVHDFRFLHHDGSDRWFIIGTKSIVDEDGNFTGALGMLTDITARKHAETELVRAQADLEQQVRSRTAELERSNRQLVQRQRAIDASAHGIIIGKVEGDSLIIDYANSASEWLTGQSPEAAVGCAWHDLIRYDPMSDGAGKISSALSTGADDNAVLEIFREGESHGWCHLHVSGVHDTNGVVTHFVLASYDITSLRQSEEKIDYFNQFDMLTGLHNPITFIKNLSLAIELASKLNHCVHLTILEVDQFRRDSDNFDEQRNDFLLREVAQRLAAARESTDAIARLGGNRFAILAPRSHDNGDAFSAQIRRIQESIALPLELSGQEVKLSANAGLATYPGDGMLPEILIERAGMAARHAKVVERNGLVWYDGLMEVAAIQRKEIDIALGKAVQRDNFFLQYQPQIDLSTKCTVGYEALLRWDDIELGYVSPARFIPLLETTGDIIVVGQRVLHKACEQAQKLNEIASEPLRMSVNLSPRQFSDPQLVECVQAALDASRLPPNCLTLEITESVLVQDIDQAIATMHALRAIGVGLSIDDFGTGYSSLAYLKRFPLTELKIDQSFVRDIMTDPGDALIVSSVINLARKLGLQVVAEGVETEAQLRFLTSHGCNVAQGYLFSRPQDAADLRVN
jgi:PAS domain S-box-containing protein/diguanylate cyclase (GGDEF)-like protein